MLLEQLCHSDSCFVTLTYAPENLPTTGSLEPEVLQRWLKRLRKRIADSPYPTLFRYFAVGEYGDESQRPHYHAILFGIGRGYHNYIDASWGLGLTDVADATQHSMAYVAGYVTKKMTAETDARLRGRHPEFARMSLRPGIGAVAIPELGKVLTSEHGSKALRILHDVPETLKQGRKNLLLGRYLRQKLREEIGMDPETPPHVREARKEEMRALQNEVGPYAFKYLKPMVDWNKVEKMEKKQVQFRKRKSL